MKKENPVLEEFLEQRRERVISVVIKIKQKWHIAMVIVVIDHKTQIIKKN